MDFNKRSPNVKKNYRTIASNVETIYHDLYTVNTFYLRIY